MNNDYSSGKTKKQMKKYSTARATVFSHTTPACKQAQSASLAISQKAPQLVCARARARARTCLLARSHVSVRCSKGSAKPDCGGRTGPLSSLAQGSGGWADIWSEPCHGRKVAGCPSVPTRISILDPTSQRENAGIIFKTIGTSQ